MIHFGPPEDTGPLDEALSKLDQFDWLIFTSQVAVEFVLQRAVSIGVPLPQSAPSLRVAVVGPKTAEIARNGGLQVDYVTGKNQGSAFVEELAQELKGKRVFLPHSDLAIKSVVEGLRQAGAEVSGVIAYRTLPPSPEERRQVKAIQWGVIDAALFFSPSAVHNFVDAIGVERIDQHHRHVLFVAVGPVTAEALHKAVGFENIIQASHPSVTEVLRSMEEFFARDEKAPLAKVNRQ
jgi:uroporphyrinogen-III synthase